MGYDIILIKGIETLANGLKCIKYDSSNDGINVTNECDNDKLLEYFNNHVGEYHLIENHKIVY